jgi:uncharacterized protein (DUF362 family)
VIADGITAMAGNGPLQESAHQFWKIVPADDSVAADATTARLMSFDPPPVRHIADGCHFLGNLHEDRIRMLAEASEIGHAGNTQTELVQLCFGDLIADGGPIGATENLTDEVKAG